MCRTHPTFAHQVHDADTRAHAHRRAGRRALALYAMRQGHPQVGHSSSATWLADLSPITDRSPPPPPASPSRGLHPPTWHTTPRAHYGSDASSLHEPRRWTFAGPARNDGLYPHLVRSRSPPSPAVTPRAPRAAEAPRPAHSGRTKSVHEPSTPEDLLAEIRAEWAFAADPVSSSTARGAVAAGQRAAAVHRANAAFFDAYADLARAAAGRVVEVKRHRLAAQHSTEKWRAAQEAHKQASAELQDAQARLMGLEAAETQRVAAAAARDIDVVPSPPADAPLDVVALQMDAGMAEMRALKEQYATLCTRKSRLEVQVEELEQAGQNLAAGLDAARQQRVQQLQQGLATSARPPSASQPPSHIFAGALEDLSVCLMERRGLLRHLREGASDRLKHFRVLTAASQDDSHATASASFPPQSSSALLDEMAEVHTALCEGEEEALNEMEQLLLLLQRRGSYSGASGQPTQSPRVPTAGTQPAVVVKPDRVATEEST